ncbi:cell division protein ZapA [Flocculibacter collagenilyticus]|uniref:cell division protein ZapA n=1 Tax=Flocculibacter collagenilyticus TaxID=2744479 RepID=UPI0018F2951A|nr:cell division protein ZapA [Flocculibacter collagenilyticus]
MQNKQVVITLLEKQYTFRCPEGKEHELFKTASKLEERLLDAKKHSKLQGNENALVLTAFNICHELLELQSKYDSLSQTVEKQAVEIADKSEKLDALAHMTQSIEEQLAEVKSASTQLNADINTNINIQDGESINEPNEAIAVEATATEQQKNNQSVPQASHKSANSMQFMDEDHYMNNSLAQAVRLNQNSGKNNLSSFMVENPDTGTVATNGTNSSTNKSAEPKQSDSKKPEAKKHFDYKAKGKRKKRR